VAAKKNGSFSAVEFAREVYAEPLGIDRLFDFDDVPDGGISAGGGQMASCQEIARAGQLILNRGQWRRGEDGRDAYQLMDANYTRQMLVPAKPGVVEGYGFLTWLNTDMRAVAASPARGNDEARGSSTSGSSHCCGPRWIGRIPPPLGRNECSTVPPTAATAVSAAVDCGVCCVARNGSEALPCEPSLPVLLEGQSLAPVHLVHTAWTACCSRETPIYNSLAFVPIVLAVPQGARTVRDRDPAEHVQRQIIGDSFPSVDQAVPGSMDSPPDLAMAMGVSAYHPAASQHFADSCMAETTA
jgi:hypothetical protein